MIKADPVQVPKDPTIPWFSDPSLPVSGILGPAKPPLEKAPTAPTDKPLIYQPQEQEKAKKIPAPFTGGQCNQFYQVVFSFRWTNEYGVQTGQGRLNGANGIPGPITEVFFEKYGQRIGCIAGPFGEIYGSPTNSNIYQPTAQVTGWNVELPPWLQDNCGDPPPLQPPEVLPPTLLPEFPPIELTPLPDLPIPKVFLPELPELPQLPIPEIPELPQPDLPPFDPPVPTFPPPIPKVFLPELPDLNVLVPTLPPTTEPPTAKPPVVIPTPDPTLCDLIKLCSPCATEDKEPWLITVVQIPPNADMSFYDSTGTRILNAGYARIISEFGYPLIGDIPIRLQSSIIYIDKAQSLEVSASKGFVIQISKV